VSDRTVRVKLTAEAAALKTEVRESIDVIGKLSKSGVVAKESLAGLEKTADKAAVGLLKLAADGKLSAAELGKTERAADELKGSLIELGVVSKLTGVRGTMATLDSQIGEARLKTEGLRREFIATGSASSFRGLKDAQADLLKLERLAKDVRATLGVPNAPTRSALPTVTKQTATPEPFQLLSGGVVGPALAAASPMIAAAIAGAVDTGIGLGFLGIGAYALKGNKDIVAAMGTLKGDIASTFTGAASPLVGPFVSALSTLDAAVKDLGPGLKSTFGALAPAIAPLAAGLGGFVKEVMPGLESAAKASVPLITELGRQLPGFGSALGTLIKDLGDVAPAAVKFLRVSFMELDGTLRVVGVAFKVLGATYGAAFDFWRGLAGQVRSAAHELGYLSTGLNVLSGGLIGTSSSGQYLGKVISDTSTATGIMGERTAYTADQLTAFQAKAVALQMSLSTVAGAMSDAVFNGLMSMDRANLSVASSLTNVTDALHKNKDALDIHTAAGQADRGAVLDAVQANIGLYDSMINSGISAQDAAASYDSNTRALESQMRAAGLTQGQIDGLIGKYKGVPSRVNTVLALQGLTDAINGLADLIREINGLSGRSVTSYINVVTRYSSTGTVAKPGQGNSRGAPLAEGGVVVPAAQGLTYGIYPASNPPLIKFAEPRTRGETLIPNYGIPANRGLALADYAASRYGGRVVTGGDTRPLQVRITVADDTGRMLRVIRQEVQGQGGNVQVVLGGYRQ
jgi:hypothetical protein